MQGTVLANANVIGNDSDPAGLALVPQMVALPLNGTATFNQDGTLDYDPNPSFFGTDTLTYRDYDGTQYSNTATVTFDVAQASPPVANNDTFNVMQGLTLANANVVANDSDPAGFALAPQLVAMPLNGTASLNSDGTFNYLPNAGFFGTDTLTYKDYDGTQYSNLGTISINVSQYAPTGNYTYSVLHDHTLPDINLAMNDMDAMGDPTQINIVSGPADGVLSRNADGTFDYTSAAHYYGSDSVTINGGGNRVGAWPTVAIGINVTDNAPVATNTSVPLEAYNGVYSGIAFLGDATDSDGDKLTVAIVSGPQHGSLALNSTTGLYDYTATAGYLGRDSFAVEYYDGAQYSQAVNVDILVYDDTTNFATDSYVQGFGDLATADTSFNGPPSPTAISQGQLKDCWFVAAEAGLANAVPISLQAAQGANGTPIITDGGAAPGGAEWYSVTFPGRAAYWVSFTPGQTFTDPNNAARQMSLTTNAGNGDWAAILEKAWAGVNAPNSATWAGSISQILDHGDSPASAIRALTGNSAWSRSFSFSINSTTASWLNTVNNSMVSVAIETSTLNSPENPTDSHGLVVGTHAYTVLGWDATTQQVHLRNPWGYNQPYTRTIYVPPTIDSSAGGGTGGTWVTQQMPALGGGGADFWLPLADFCSWFKGMDYEY
jgi:hypothetical protein